MKKKDILKMIIVMLGIMIAILLNVCTTNKREYTEVEDSYVLQKKEMRIYSYGTGMIENEKDVILQIDEEKQVDKIFVKIGQKVNVGEKICRWNTSKKKEEQKKNKKKIENLNQKKEEKCKEKEELLNQIKYIEVRKNKLKKDIEEYKKFHEEITIEIACIQKEETKREYKKFLEEIKEKKNSLQIQKKELEKNKNSVEKQCKGVELRIKKYAEKISKLKKKNIEIKKEIKNAVYKTPISGIMREVYIYENTSTLKGKIAKISNLNSYYVKAKIEEKEYKKIENGMRVEIIYKTKNGFEEIEGTVSYIGKIVKDGHYEISVQLNKNCADKQRVIGQNVAVNVVVDETFGFVIPYNYLKEKGNQSYILRYNKNKKTKEQIYVTKGLEDGYLVEINSDELNENDLIVKEE